MGCLMRSEKLTLHLIKGFEMKIAGVRRNEEWQNGVVMFRYSPHAGRIACDQSSAMTSYDLFESRSSSNGIV